VKATVTDFNVYGFPGSSWEIKAAPNNGGSVVEMIWVRELQRRPLGRFLGTVIRLAGKPPFGRDIRKTRQNLEELDRQSEATG
jgi:hypothetical protein